MSPLRAIVLAAALLVAPACRSAAPVRPVQTSREYASLRVSHVSRGGKPDDPVEDGAAYGVTGGYVLWDGLERRLFGWRGVRASVELGAAFSRLGLDTPFNGLEEADVYRFSLGGRLERDLDGLPLTPWIEGGLYVRSHGELDLDADPFDQGGHGLFVGTGVAWWVLENVALGPFVSYARDMRTNNLTETFFGVSVLIRARE